MIITNLESHLLSSLTGSQEVWIAVALMNEGGYQKLQPSLVSVKQHYLIGIDLPTTPSLLRLLKQELRPGTFDARLANYPQVFHPKVYIIKKNDRLISIVGSANLTEKGLTGNHEVCYLVDDQIQCQRLLAWFQGLYDSAYLLTESNLTEYENSFTPSNEGSGYETTRHRRPHFTRPPGDEAYFETINLSGYFFGKDDYRVFRRSLWENDKPEASRERGAVMDKFLALHDIIFPQFNAYDIGDLDRHRREQNIVSLHYHIPNGPKHLNAMWLSYGKQRAEIKRYQDFHKQPRGARDDERDPYSFVNHARLQVRIELKSLGIWILFAKKGSGDYDRGHFRREMNNPAYRQAFFKLLTALPYPYWIRVNDQRRAVSDFPDADHLHQFCQADRVNEYFTIGRDYEITDRALLLNQLPITVLEEFHRLFPIYDMMRHRMPAL